MNIDVMKLAFEPIGTTFSLLKQCKDLIPQS